MDDLSEKTLRACLSEALAEALKVIDNQNQYLSRATHDNDELVKRLNHAEKRIRDLEFSLKSSISTSVGAMAADLWQGLPEIDRQRFTDHYIATNDLIGTIKFVRQETGWGLYETKQVVSLLVVRTAIPAAN